MPDANKFMALRGAGYQIPVLCCICLHRNMGAGGVWGTCKQIKYAHLKHTGPEREASIHRYGTCPEAKLDDVQSAKEGFGAHIEFLKKE